MKALPALAERTAQIPVYLVTMTARDGTVWRFASKDTYYDHAGSGSPQDYFGAVASISPIDASADYQPTQLLIGGVNPFGQGFTVDLVNVTLDDGATVASAFHATDVLFADVEFAMVFRGPGDDLQDLRDLGASRPHVVFARGRVERWEMDSRETLRLSIGPDIPRIAWERPTNPGEAALEDRSSIYPAPVGEARRVRVVKRIAGVETTLAESLSQSATTTLRLTSVFGLPPSGTFFLRINGEEIECQDPDTSGVITIVARGTSGTTAVRHDAGEVAIEVTDVTLVLGSDVQGIDTLYLRNPYDGALFAVPPNRYVFNPFDATVDPGRILATAFIETDNLRSILTEMQRQAQVTVQPDFDDTSGGGGSTSIEEIPAGNGHSNTNSTGWRNITSGGATNPNAPGGVQLDRLPNVSGEGAIRAHLNANEFSDAETQSGLTNPSATRYRMRVEGDITNPGAFQNGDGLGLEIVRRNLPGWSDGSEIEAPINPIAGPFTWTSDWKNVGTLTASPNGAASGSRWWAEGNPPGTAGSDADITISKMVLEVEVKSGSTAADIERIVDTEIEAGSVGIGLEFFADIRGAFVPYDSQQLYNFDDLTGWTATGGAIATPDQAEKFEGVASLRIERGQTLTETLVDDCETAARWSTRGAGATSVETAATPGGMPTQGTGYTDFTTTHNRNLAIADLDLAPAGQDFSLGLVRIDVEVDDLSWTRLAGDFGFGISFIDGSGLGNHFTFGVTAIPAPDQVVTLDLDVANPGNGGMETGFDPTDVDALIFEWNQANYNGSVGTGIRIDNLRKTDYALGGGLVYRQVPVADWTSQDDIYSPAVRVDDASEVSSVEIIFSHQSMTGGRPNNYRQLTIPGSALRDGQWLTPTVLGQDIGSPTLTAIDWLGVEVFYTGATAPVVWVDDLVGADPSSAAWPIVGLVPGELIENPALAVLYAVARKAGLAESQIDFDSISDAIDATTPNVLAGDIRALGTDFLEILQALAFETRVQTFSVQRLDGMLLKAFAAPRSYKYPAPTVTLPGRWLPAGRSIGEIVNQSASLYAYDASAPFDEGAFAGRLLAGASANETRCPTEVLEASEARYGPQPLQGDPFAFLMTQDQATAQDQHGWIAHESARVTRGRYRTSLLAYQAAALELFDGPVWIQPVDQPAPVGAILVSVRHDPGRGTVDLIAEQVETE